MTETATGVRGSREGVGGFWVEAVAHPERVAIVDVDGTEQTAGSLLSRVNRLSRAMVADGIEPGSGVAIFTWNRSDTIALILAASQIGAYYTMVNTHLAAPEVAYILRDSDPKLLFVDHHTAELGEKAATESGLIPDAIRSLDADQGFMTLNEWIAALSEDRPERRIAGSQMMYTSGTSGLPKGVRPELTGQDPDVAAAMAPNLVRRYGVDPATWVGTGVHLVTSPLYHGAPMGAAVVSLHLGHRAIVMERFDAQTALHLISEHGVTWTQVVPTMMQRIMDLPEEVRGRYDTSSLVRFLHAGAPCPAELKRRVIDWLGPVVWEFYASTECGGTAIGAEDWLAHPGSVGRAWPGADVRILDDDGSEMPTGGIGTIYMLNPRPFSYRNDPGKTEEALRGRYATVGDMGWVDDGGYLYIADRRGDLILVGGVNVYPAEVEEVLSRHPRVYDVAVIGKPDADLGQAVHAVVQPRGEVTDPDALAVELADFLEERLGRQKRPRSYDFANKFLGTKLANSCGGCSGTNSKGRHDGKDVRANSASRLFGLGRFPAPRGQRMHRLRRPLLRSPQRVRQLR